MSDLLGHKRIRVLAIASITGVCISLALAVVVIWQQWQLYQLQAILVRSQLQLLIGCPKPQVLDSDGDGLSDIDEASYATNPRKLDTDDDGYSDGEEVQNGYNPLGVGRIHTNTNTK